MCDVLKAALYVGMPSSGRPVAEVFLRECWAPSQVPRMYTHPHPLQTCGEKEAGRQEGTVGGRKVWARKGRSLWLPPSRQPWQVWLPTQAVGKLRGGLYSNLIEELFASLPPSGEPAQSASWYHAPLNLSGHSLRVKCLPSPPFAF